MNKIQKIIAGILAAFIIVIIGYSSLGSKHSFIVGSIAGTGEPTGFDNVSLTGGLKVGVSAGDVSVPSYGVGSILATGPLVASSTVYQALGAVSGGICSVSTASTTNALQLTSTNIANCSLLSITSGTSTALTVTLPASSTISSISNIGDSFGLYIYSASTTGGTIVIAATSSGFSLTSPLTVASTTSATTTIAAGKSAILDAFRLPTTDVMGILTVSK